MRRMLYMKVPTKYLSKCFVAPKKNLKNTNFMGFVLDGASKLSNNYIVYNIKS